MTRAPLMKRLRKEILEIGEHQGICSVGTQMLKIHEIYSINITKMQRVMEHIK
jgi:hypothetical protein